MRLFENLRDMRSELGYVEGSDVLEARRDFITGARHEDDTVVDALYDAYRAAAEQDSDWIHNPEVHLGCRIALADVWLEAGYAAEAWKRLDDDAFEIAWNTPGFEDKAEQLRVILLELNALINPAEQAQDGESTD